MPACQFALAEQIFPAGCGAGGEGAGRRAREDGIGQFGGSLSLAVAVEHQTADGGSPAHCKGPEAEQWHRAVGAGPCQHLLLAYMLALSVGESVVEAEEERLIAVFPTGEHCLLPVSIVGELAAADPGLADRQLASPLELVGDGGAGHLAFVKQYQGTLQPSHQLTHLADAALEQGALQYAGDQGVADQPLGARILVHPEKHHGRSPGGDGSGEGVDGVVIPQDHQRRLVGPVGGHSLGEQFVTGLAGLALGVQIEIAEVMRLLEVLLEASTVALIPLVALVITADHQDLGGQQREGEEGEQEQDLGHVCFPQGTDCSPVCALPLSGASVNCCRKACPSLFIPCRAGARIPSGVSKKSAFWRWS